MVRKKMIAPNGEEVIYIEYIDGIPHEVLTAPIDGHGLTWFDFKYVYGDRKDIRYREVGGGGRRDEIQAPHYVNPGPKYWMANGCKYRGKSKAINCERINRPLRVKGWSKSSINPFKVSDETSYYFEYCEDCNQWTCDGEGCRDHQHWDDDLSMLVYNKDGKPAE